MTHILPPDKLLELYNRAWRKGAAAKSENSSEDWPETQILDGFQQLATDALVAELKQIPNHTVVNLYIRNRIAQLTTVPEGGKDE